MGNKFVVLIQNEMSSSCKDEVTNFTSKWIRSKIIIWVVKPILPKAKTSAFLSPVDPSFESLDACF